MYSINYNGIEIKYDVVRSKIKNVYIHIKEGNVIVKAPIRINQDMIQRIVEDKKEWIYIKIEQRKKQSEASKKQMKLLGKTYPIEVIHAENTNTYIENGKMIVEMPETKEEKQEEIIRKVIEDIYFKVAEREVDIAMQIVTRIVGIKPNKYRVKKLKTAWGTCSSNKNISINPELMKYDREVIQYVVLHEICHIKYMNHSKEFWNMVGKYMANYKEVRRRLKDKEI